MTGGRIITNAARITLNYQTPSEFAAGWRKGHSENEDSDVTN
jgi:hypothetical protein